MIQTPSKATSTAKPATVIRVTLPREEIQEAREPAIQEALWTVAEQGRSPDGPLFSHHFDMQPGTFGFHVGVPLKSPSSPPAGCLPPGFPPVRSSARFIRFPMRSLGPHGGSS